MHLESKRYKVCMVNKNKCSFDDKDDDKRRVQADGITALARGYFA